MGWSEVTTFFIHTTVLDPEKGHGQYEHFVNKAAADLQTGIRHYLENLPEIPTEKMRFRVLLRYELEEKDE